MHTLRFAWLGLLLSAMGPLWAQDVTLTTDTEQFRYPQNQLSWLGQSYFYFEPHTANPEYEISIRWSDQPRIRAVQLLPSPDYRLVDSLRLVEGEGAVGRIQLLGADQTLPPRLVFALRMADSTLVNRSLRLYPYYRPILVESTLSTELYRDEEKAISVPVQFPQELDLPSGWRQEGTLSYRWQREGEQLKLILKCSEVGRQSVRLPLNTRRPYLNDQGLATQQVGFLQIQVESKPSPLSYLNLDQRDVFYEAMGAGATLVQMNRAPGLRVGRTYRIEDQEGPGGRLVAELFVRAYVDNQDKMLGVLRTYALHREEEGYLYLKAQEQARFFTNFNILAKPSLQRVSVLRPGQDWTQSLTVYPGEELELRMEGEGLEKATFKLGEGSYALTPDSARQSNTARYFSVTIPVDVKESRIGLSMNGHPSSFELLVREHSKAHDLNFVQIDYGQGPQIFTAPRFDKPATHEGEIRDITVSFRPYLLDEEGDLHGVQYLEVEVRITGPDKKLIEIREINDIKVLPAPVSPRYAYYDASKATLGVIRLNDYLANKTYDWQPWTQAEITVRHKSGTYANTGQTRKVTIIPSQRLALQLEVSFPAGLLTKKFNEPGIGSLTGISTAALVQASFYTPGRINKLSPWKVGGGFLALNALTGLNDDPEEKDLGVLGMVSFYPINTDSKVKFPLHAGIGYLFKSNTMFMVVGPGVQVNF